MMKLLAAGASPFVRKVRLTASVKGLGGQLEVIQPDDPGIDQLKARNPLGKIPVLLCDDGTTIFDSHVICEYLDGQAASPVLFPGDGQARWEMLTRAALADGILEAGVLIVYETRFRPEDKYVESWVAMQQTKIDTAVAQLEAAPPEWKDHPDYSHITVATALGYLDFRQDGKWRAANPNMVRWLDEFRQAVPGFDESAPPAS